MFQSSIVLLVLMQMEPFWIRSWVLESKCIARAQVHHAFCVLLLPADIMSGAQTAKSAQAAKPAKAEGKENWAAKITEKVKKFDPKESVRQTIDAALSKSLSGDSGKKTWRIDFENIEASVIEEVLKSLKSESKNWEGQVDRIDLGRGRVSATGMRLHLRMMEDWEVEF
jgi:hypothetical protein